jgi:sugar transferase (PEP-CTERM/EpsH1 system associated)
MMDQVSAHREHPWTSSRVEPSYAMRDDQRKDGRPARAPSELVFDEGRREPRRPPERTDERPAQAPVKVAHIVLALNMGGLERVILRLIERTDRSRFAPMICALDEPGELSSLLEKLDVPMVVLGRKTGIDLDLALRLSTFLQKEGIRIVHTHNAGPHFYGAIAANFVRLRQGHGPRVLHTKHGPPVWSSRWTPRLNQLSSWLSDRVIAVSDHTREIALTTEGVRPDKLFTVVNGVDPDEYAPGGDQAAARRRLGVPQGGVHIGCVARLQPVKDHATLIDAFARLREKRDDVYLTLVGEGATRQGLEEQVARLNLREAVFFAGARLDIPEILPAFDIFALSSLTEGISLTLIEAAAAGLPIVATNVGGNGQIIDELKSGRLVPPRDPDALATALHAMVCDPDRATLGMRGRQRVIERFSADRMTRTYESLYEELLQK